MFTAANMIALLLTLCLCFPVIQALNSQFQFKRIWLETSEWSQYITKLTEKDIVQSKIECGSECANFIHNQACDVFVVENEKCYTGFLSHSKNDHVSGLSGTQGVYVNLAKVKSDLNSIYHHLTYVSTETIWSKHVYASEEMVLPMDLLDCIFHCLNVQKPNGCEFFAYEDDICYFGKTSHTSGSLEVSVINATIYVNEAGKNTFISTHGPKEDVASTLWTPHIEKTRTSIDNEEHCAVFAQLEQWHFSAHDSDAQTCFLGIMETESILTTTNTNKLKLTFNLDLLNEFRDEEFYSRTSSRHQPFIYAHFPTTKNTQHCSMHCYFDPTSNCDFHFLSGNECYLGNMNTASAIGSPGGTFTMYIYKESVQSVEDKLFPGVTDFEIAKWSKHIREVVTVLDEPECQAHAVLYNDAPIDFYVYQDNTCHLGDLAHSQGGTSDAGTNEVRIRSSNALDHMNSVYNAQFPMEGSVWNKHVFESLEAHDLSECSVMCELHKDNCDFFTFLNNQCYLALYSKMDGTADVSNELTTYHKTGDLDSFAGGQFWSWNDGYRWQQFIYKYRSNNHIRGCSMACIHDNECQFYTFWNNNCWYGKMDYSGSLLTSSSHNQEVFFKESINDIGFISSKFQDRNGDINNGNTRLMHYVYWRQGIYWTGDDSYTNGARCARRCLLAHDSHCHYYIVKNGRCQLGRFTHGGGNYHGSFSNSDIIRLKKHIGKSKMPV